ncbi:hypothetical protein Nepgr_007419 [Nepenthes gracilis]|uniref:Uncharacterized protein n=1 Tax=Nepenthes gracilis TaxID=150966 RepID=A0AAD3XIB9_NEPGR|nr:hypothetical protein Nepgr_007419 [Nepenthes gracilis]
MNVSSGQCASWHHEHADQVRRMIYRLILRDIILNHHKQWTLNQEQRQKMSQVHLSLNFKRKLPHGALQIQLTFIIPSVKRALQQQLLQMWGKDKSKLRKKCW